MKGRAALGLAAAATLVAILLALTASGDDQFEQDKKVCAPQLVKLTPCLPYVGGNAKMPTMDCCTAVNQVLATSKKCLCLLIKYRNEPDLGVTFNLNLTLGLPSVCHSPSNASDCPAILHLPANSTDAKVFTDFFNGSNNSTPTPSSSTAPPASSSASTGSSKNIGGGPHTLRFGALSVFYGFIVIFFFLVFCPIY